ncbi:MAG: hypothetical protein WBP61_05445, partial [Nocardioides sp.]
MSVRKILLASVACLGTAALGLGLLVPAAPADPGTSRSGTTVLAATARVAPGAKLEVATKGSYVGGQALKLVGSLGVPGVRRIWIERHMNRASDQWMTVEHLGYRGKTRKNGSFTMRIGAPGMFGVSYRVRGTGGVATPAHTFEAKTQDVSVEVVGSPVAGLPFVIRADTTPDFFKRPDSDGLPVFDGRKLTLQHRVTPTVWASVATTTVGSSGAGTFPPIVEEAGEHVYRVRLEDWTAGGSKVGWAASFPTYVTVHEPGDRTTDERSVATPVPAPVTRQAEKGVVVTGTAAGKYGWYPLRWSFDWEEGEDLDTPAKGNPRKGRWLEYADGAGRTSKHNGGLRLDSGRLEKDGKGDFGTTRATVAGNASTYGRWEARLRAKTFETRSKDYDIVLELVPERAADYECGRHNVTIARYSGVGSRMTFGVNAGGKRWTRTISGPHLERNIPAFAVEVGKKHLS